ncbi:hypothetical protein [Chitiniphilus eburneus]|uniref:Uncharacterized protein n=1 Tax=Chitiniphilus eburneus TaxID=2571148 RepID=A0A4U0PGZ3_9NEIS|nr:hypothetical protein [Chitiniphilus eburneus]TJZ67127.1 hypothetical protein FAZ21_16480 [Chitiniphilus eburneus]
MSPAQPVPQILVRGGTQACRAQVRRVARATLAGNPGYTGTRIIPFGDEMAMLRFYDGRCVAQISGEGEPQVWGDIGPSPQALRRPWLLDARGAYRVRSTPYHRSSLAADGQHYRQWTGRYPECYRPELNGGLCSAIRRLRIGKRPPVNFQTSGFGIAPLHGRETRSAIGEGEGGGIVFPGWLSGMHDLWGGILDGDNVYPYAARYFQRTGDIPDYTVDWYLGAAFPDGVQHQTKIVLAEASLEQFQPLSYPMGFCCDHGSLITILVGTSDSIDSTLTPEDQIITDIKIHDTYSGWLHNKLAVVQTKYAQYTKIWRKTYRVSRSGITLESEELVFEQTWYLYDALMFEWAETPQPINGDGSAVAPGTSSSAYAAANDMRDFLADVSAELKAGTIEWYPVAAGNYGVSALYGSTPVCASRICASARYIQQMDPGPVPASNMLVYSLLKPIFDACGVPAGRPVMFRLIAFGLPDPAGLNPDTFNFMSSAYFGTYPIASRFYELFVNAPGLPYPSGDAEWLYVIPIMTRGWTDSEGHQVGPNWITLWTKEYRAPLNWYSMPYIYGPDDTNAKPPVPPIPDPSSGPFFFADVLEGSGSITTPGEIGFKPIDPGSSITVGDVTFAVPRFTADPGTLPELYVFRETTLVASAQTNWYMAAGGGYARAQTFFIMRFPDGRSDFQPYNPGKYDYAIKQSDGFATLLIAGSWLGTYNAWSNDNSGPPSENPEYWGGFIADSTAASRDAAFDVTDDEGTPTRCLIVGQYLNERCRIRLVLVPAPGLAGPIVLDAQQFMALPTADAYALAELPVVARGAAQSINPATMNWVNYTELA